MTDFTHQSVLLNEAVAALGIKEAGCYIDGTFGRGGHASQILKQLNREGRLIAIDKDPEAQAESENNVVFQAENFEFCRQSFDQLLAICRERALVGKIDGVLLDLGMSSPQIDNPERGFSFRHEGPLDMRMDTESGIAAKDWINEASEDQMVWVFKVYGEERYARRIARAILTAREIKPIETTQDLVAVIVEAAPSRERKKHPATRVFQAIRIFINDELEVLPTCLEQILEVLRPGGRVVVISFHSLEDRIVKRFIRQHEKGASIPKGLPIKDAELPQRLRKIGGATRASEQELVGNPRARSAVMRIAEKVS